MNFRIIYAVAYIGESEWMALVRVKQIVQDMNIVVSPGSWLQPGVLARNSKAHEMRVLIVRCSSFRVPEPHIKSQYTKAAKEAVKEPESYAWVYETIPLP